MLLADCKIHSNEPGSKSVFALTQNRSRHIGGKSSRRPEKSRSTAFMLALGYFSMSDLASATVKPGTLASAMSATRRKVSLRRSGSGNASSSASATFLKSAARFSRV